MNSVPVSSYEILKTGQNSSVLTRTDIISLGSLYQSCSPQLCIFLTYLNPTSYLEIAKTETVCYGSDIVWLEMYCVLLLLPGNFCTDAQFSPRSKVDKN